VLTLALELPAWLDFVMSWGFILGGAYLALEVVGIVFAADAVMHGRTPQGTIAWVGALVVIPLFAVPVYLLFGSRRIAGYVRARRRGKGGLVKLAQQVHEAMMPHAVARGGVLSPESADWLGLMPAVGGNRLDLLIDGERTFESIFAAIDAAERTLCVQFYILRYDGIGRELFARLRAASARGVAVHLLYDSIGSSGLPRRVVQELRSAGVRVRDFRPSRAPRFKVQLNFRNHRKIVVADGRVALLGGHNVGDEYLGRCVLYGAWRDTHLRIEGPAVLAVQMAFTEDWYCCTRSVPDLVWTCPGAAVEGGGGAVAIIPTGPADELETALLMFLRLIHSASKRLWIATPYYVPDEAVTAAIQAAALRGVDVKILIPRCSDNRLVDLAARSAVEDVIAARVEIYEFGKDRVKGVGGGILHQKVILADGVAAIGSANLDNRSLRINFEITAVSNDADLVAATEAMLKRDFADARRLRIEDLNRPGFRGWTRRFLRRTARLLSPIL
jgi:cardiolipin synthase A/B